MAFRISTGHRRACCEESLTDFARSGHTLEKLLAPAVLAHLAAGELHGYE